MVTETKLHRQQVIISKMDTSSGRMNGDAYPPTDATTRTFSLNQDYEHLLSQISKVFSQHSGAVQDISSFLDI